MSYDEFEEALELPRMSEIAKVMPWVEARRRRKLRVCPYLDTALGDCRLTGGPCELVIMGRERLLGEKEYWRRCPVYRRERPKRPPPRRETAEAPVTIP